MSIYAKNFYIDYKQKYGKIKEWTKDEISLLLNNDTTKLTTRTPHAIRNKRFNMFNSTSLLYMVSGVLNIPNTPNTPNTANTANTPNTANTRQTNRARQKSSFTGSANCTFFCKALRTVSNTFYISFPLHLKWITTF